jgi:uncharacterized protein YggE
MKAFILPLIFILFSPFVVSGQHSENQVQFRSSKKEANTYRRLLDNNSEQYQEQAIRGIAPSPAKNEMLLQCSVLMNVKADSYMAIFNLTQVGATAQEADAMLSNRANLFIQALSKLGIQTSDIYADMIYLIPIFEYETEKRLFSKTYNEVPKGFEMQKNLHVRFKKSDILDDIVTLAASNEIYDLVTIEYFVKDSKAIYDSIRTQAVDFVSKNAGKLKKVGLNLEGEFRIVSENSGVVYPETQYSDYQAFVSQSLDAAKNKAVTSMRKPKTVAYNKLPYNDFDIVVNPEFLEPVVQFTYKLEVKYTLNKEKLEPKNNYYIVDPAGNLKQIIVK